MKKIAVLLVMTALIFSSCEKNVGGPEEQYAEVAFSVNEADFVTLKAGPGTPGGVPICSDLSMDYAIITIDQVEYTTDIFYANEKYVTQPIKVLMGEEESKNVVITKFLVYHDNTLDPDSLIRAAPEPGSDYFDFVMHPDRALDLTITVTKFDKVEAAIDVLCFEDLYYLNFGFTWFKLDLMTVKSLCFFGDICTGKLDQYINPENSPYAGQAGNYDLGAVMKVAVHKRNNTEGDNDYTLVREYSNEGWLTPGVGDCMQVYWGDYDEMDEDYIIELYVLLPSGNALTYQLIETWEFNDDAIGTDDPSYPQTNMYGEEEDDDGVVDFVIGNCAYDDPDYTFAPHQNLPTEDLTLYYHAPVYANGYYVMLTLTKPSGDDGTYSSYDFPLGTQIGGWCADENIYIYNPTTVKAYSSLKDFSPWIDGTNLTEDKISKLNYMFNHLGDVLTGIEYEAISTSQGEIIQEAIWTIIDGSTSSNTTAQMLVNNAITGYVPQPGEWAAVIFYDGLGEGREQIMFTIVDP